MGKIKKFTNAEEHMNFGNLLLAKNKYAEAAKYYKQALKLNPNHARAWGNLGAVYKFLNKLPLAEESLKKAIAINPNLPHLFYNLGIVFEEQKHIRKAIVNIEQAIKLDPDFKEAINHLFLLRRQICDWGDIDKLEKILDEKDCDTPFSSIMRQGDPAKNLATARNWCQKLEKTIPGQLFTFDIAERKKNNKVRVGYISRDFRKHPIGQLVAAMFDYHDRSKFKIQAYAYGVKDDSVYRQMIEAGVDNFVDLAPMGDLEAAQRIYHDQVDILVDLTGHTGENRMAICALRPAPVQVSWLGFPGTSGAGFFDYAIVDKTLVPQSHVPFYSEKLVFLPRCYQVNNNKIVISNKRYTRQDFGLPEKGIVFTSFNQTYKIEPVIFGIWMTILKRVPGSILWLWKHTSEAAENLKAAAAYAKVDPKRLIFSDKLSKEEHLKRIALADLGLDIRIYGGHTTTSDCLWAGVPVLTKMGNHFASRVCASVLTEALLPELITHSLKEYEDKAVYLAHNPKVLTEIRRKITHKHLQKNLYDTGGFVKDLEKAYLSMWETLKA